MNKEQALSRLTSLENEAKELRKIIESPWTDDKVKKILHAAIGNMKDFAMDNDGFIEQFKISHSIPLFFSEDGIALYKGDSCWIYDTSAIYSHICQWVNICKEGFYTHYKLFSTKEAAKEYDLINNRILSINDIVESFNNRDFVGTEYTVAKLKEIVKQRL